MTSPTGADAKLEMNAAERALHVGGHGERKQGSRPPFAGSDPACALVAVVRLAAEMAASDGRKGRPWRRLREQVLREEPWCRYCGVRPSVQVDHVWPLSMFPTLAHERSNLAGSCSSCNGSKGDRLPGQLPAWPPTRTTDVRSLTW